MRWCCILYLCVTKKQMKKYLLLSLIIFSSMIISAGNPINNSDKKNTVLLSGKVIDKASGEELAGAEIVINDKTYYSDLSGMFTAMVEENTKEAVVKYVSYKDTKVNINPYTFNTITIEMPSK